MVGHWIALQEIGSTPRNSPSDRKHPAPLPNICLSFGQLLKNQVMKEDAPVRSTTFFM
jgi:hypothetical protein